MTTLKEILNKKTEQYLNDDNPCDAEFTMGNSIARFFYLSGPKGRKRAQDYIAEINIYTGTKYTQDRLLQEVYDDVMGVEKPIGLRMAQRLKVKPGAVMIRRLGTSQVYRKRIIEALCDYLNINMEDINTRAKRLYISTGSSTVYGAPAVSWQNILNQLTESEITKRIEVLNGRFIENKIFYTANNNL